MLFSFIHIYIYIVKYYDWILTWKHNFTSGSRNADVADTWTWLNQGTIYGSGARPFRSFSLHNRSRLLDSPVTLVLSLGFLVKPLFGCWENRSLTKKNTKNGRKMKYWFLRFDFSATKQILHKKISIARMYKFFLSAFVLVCYY